MVRILGWIVLLFAFSLVVLWLSEHPGNVEILWLGYEIRIQIAILLALVFLSFLLLLPILYFLRYLLGLPMALRLHGRENRQKRGMSALTHALTALAVSDVESAARQTRKAAEYLGEGPLTALLGAQIAYRQDDLRGTRQHLKEMLDYSETKFIAARALSAFARAEGNYPAAIAFARDALKEDPHSLWSYRSLLDLYMREERWQEAETLIRQAKSKRRIDAENARHLLALFYHVQAERALQEGQRESAWRAAMEAHKQEAGFLPSSLLLVKLLGEKGERRKALSVLEKSFKVSPHPELSEALLDLCQDEAANKLSKRAKALAAACPAHPESQLMQAVVAMHLEQWDAARNHIKSALSVAESARPYRLLAIIETRQYDNRSSANEWLARAAEATPDPLWICTACGHQHKRWQLHCAHCESFDTLQWTTPREHLERRPASFLLEQG